MSDQSNVPVQPENATTVPPGRVSRVPSRIWLIVLIALAIAAMGAQGWGLRSLVEFNSMKEQWLATVAQRQSLREEWEKLAEDQKQQAMAAKSETEKLKAHLAVMQSDKGNMAAELAGIKEQLDQAQKTRDGAVEKTQAARLEEKATLDQRERILADIKTLSDKQLELQTEREKLTSDVERLKASTAQGKQGLDSLKADLDAAQKELQASRTAQAAAVDVRGMAQSEWLKIFEDTNTAKKQAANAEAATHKAESDLADLESKAKEVRALIAQKDKLVADSQATQDQLKAITSTVATKTAELDQARKSFDELTKDIAVKRIELDALQKRMDATRQDERSLVASVKRLVTEIATTVPASQPSDK